MFAKRIYTPGEIGFGSTIKPCGRETHGKYYALGHPPFKR